MIGSEEAAGKKISQWEETWSRPRLHAKAKAKAKYRAKHTNMNQDTYIFL